jgi:hypothetical protein
MGFTANVVPALFAAAAAWIFGAVYYHSLSRQWLAAQGKTPEQFGTDRAAAAGTFAAIFPFVLSFVAEFAMAWVLSGILTHLGRFTVRAGMISGAFVWFGFVLTTIAVNNTFGGRKAMLTLIDAGHWLGVLLIMGAMVGWLGS